MNNSELDLSALEHAELLDLFQTLDAPTLAEMNGEFSALMLRQRSLLAKLTWAAVLYNPVWPGMWLGKAFRPVSDTGGRGYNVFRHFGRIAHRLPMRTLIAPSRYDRRPAFQLVYRAFDSVCGLIHMVDEIRRVRAGEYLLIGTYGFTKAQRHVPSLFLLTGPVAPYGEDVGVERESYPLELEVPELNHEQALPTNTDQT